MSLTKQIPIWASAVLDLFPGAASFTAGSGSTITLTSRVPNIFGNNGDYIEFDICQSSLSSWTVFGSQVSQDAIILTSTGVTLTDGSQSHTLVFDSALVVDTWYMIRLYRESDVIKCKIEDVEQVDVCGVVPMDIDIIGKNTSAYTDVKAVKLAGFDGDYLHNATPSAAVQGADTGFWRSGWFYLDSVGDHTIADCLTGNNGWRIEVENVYLSAHRLKFTVGNGTTTVSLSSTETFSEKELIHFYVDLEDLGETEPDAGDTTIDGTFTPEDGDFYVGATRGTSNFFDGKIDSLFGGDGNLSLGQITWLENGGLGRVVDEIGAGTTVSTSDIDFGWGLEETSGTRADAFGSDDLTEVAGTPVTDGFEAVTGGAFDNWDVSENGTTTVNVESSDVRTGTYAARIDVDALDSRATITYNQSPSFTSEKEYTFSVWAKASATGVIFRMQPLNSATAVNKEITSTSYTEYTVTTTSIGSSPKLIAWSDAASESLYFDDVSITSTSIVSSTLLGTSYTNASAFTGYLRNVKLNALAGYVNIPLLNNANDIGGDSNDGTATSITFVDIDPGA